MNLNEAIAIAKKECKNPYAQTYLRAIPEAIEFGGQVSTAKDGLRVQLLYCLGNMTTWRGETAREVKKVMNAWIKANK